MSDQPSTIAREAKGTHQALKEALKTREPWDREVDFQRRNLRRHYLSLLLAHPYSKESKDAETYLWMQTSYTFIALYKQRIQALQRMGPAHPQLRSPRDSHQQQQHAGHGAVEYRKFLQRFRQFLAEEEKFWALLVVRFCRSFALDEAQPVLVALGILPSAHGNSVTADTAGLDQNDAATAGLGTTHDAHGNSSGRGHTLFPAEESTPSVIPKTPAQRASRFAILCKALVCLGDIARYRELYNESGGRPKAGQEEGVAVPLRGKAIRGKRGGGGQGHDGAAAMGRARNYDRAKLYYEQARLLVPSEGNASHQLAILASYKKDAFGSLVHYYRALCVRQPYDTASENLGTVLSKALEQWRARTKKEKGPGSGTKEGEQGAAVAQAPWKRAEMMMEKVVVLHALWRLGVEKMDAISPKHAQDVRDDLYGLVSERCLLPDLISKMVILSQGALWKHRMIREPNAPGSPKDNSEDPSPTTMAAQAIEARMLVHVLAIHQVLMEIGLSELSETPPEDAAENDLAQRITAPFRRTLPALRIASKWLRANHKYVQQSRLLEEPGIVKGKEGRSLVTAAEELSASVLHFWTKYAEFSTSLRRTFPPEHLPVLKAPLEEDVEMRGFLPLKQMMGDVKSANGDDQKDAGPELPNKITSGDDLVHPNEEQLMRIADLLNDAKILAQSNDSLVNFTHGEFTLRTLSTASRSTGPQNGQNDQSSRIPPGDDVFVMHNVKERDEDTMTETTSRTDDDPVRLAFQTALDPNAHLDDDDDRIVWDLRPPVLPAPIAIPSALPSSPSRASPLTPIKPTLGPIGTAARSPTSAKGQTPFATPLTMPSTTTAQDLLNNVMGVPRVPGAGIGLTHGSSNAESYRSHVIESSAPQPQLLFGSGLVNQPDHSIWSRTADERTIHFTGTGTSSTSASGVGAHLGGTGQGSGLSYHLGQQQLFPSTSSQDFAQSIWSSLYPVSTSPQQGHVSASISAAQPLGTFALPSHPLTGDNGVGSGLATHQRTLSSSSTSVGQTSTGHHRKHSSDDPLLYTTLPIGSTRQQQQQHQLQHLNLQQQLHSGMRPIGTRSFSSSLSGYSALNKDTGDGMGMRYGQGSIQDYDGGYAHQPRVSHVVDGAPLSSGWGNT